MWHFNALFQPAKCLLICKPDLGSSCSFAASLPLSLSLSFSLHPFPPRPLSGHLVSLSPLSPLFSPPASVFGILLSRSVVADLAFVSSCCRCSYGDGFVLFFFLKATLRHLSHGKKVYRTLFPPFAPWRPPGGDNATSQTDQFSFRTI